MRPALPPLFAVALLATTPAVAQTPEYPAPPEAKPRQGVPRGKVTKHSFAASKVFPGTVRDYWVYVSAQLERGKPAPVMVFQDGGGYVDPKGAWQVPTVFDNLIADRAIPPLVGVFVDWGKVPAAGKGAVPRMNRSFEYDGAGDSYARLLVDELLPEVNKLVPLATDAASRAIAGASSGAIAAFNVAWERPDAFSRVFSTIGTYVGLRGGDAFPALVRKTEPRGIRVFLQDGDHDLDIYAGDWWIANQAMLSALKFAGYEVSHAWGHGGHDSKHGASVLPEALRYLWQGYPARPAAGVGSRAPSVKLAPPGTGWQLVGEGYGFAEGPAVNARGELFFVDVPQSRIHRVDLEGKVTVFASDTAGASGLMFGADGKLYAAQNGRQRIVAYDEAGKETVVAEGLDSNDLAVSVRGDVYVTDPAHKQVWLVPRKGAGWDKPRVVDTGREFANGVLLSPDQTFLYVSDSRGRYVWSYQIGRDGGLLHKQPWCWLHAPDLPLESGADGMTVDTEGRLYVTTRLGVQICDQAGRVNVILDKPDRDWLSNVAFAGPGRDELYVTTAKRVWKRKLAAKGVVSFEPPITPPPARL